MKAFAVACLIWLGFAWLVALLFAVPLTLAVRIYTLFAPRK